LQNLWFPFFGGKIEYIYIFTLLTCPWLLYYYFLWKFSLKCDLNVFFQLAFLIWILVLCTKPYLQIFTMFFFFLFTGSLLDVPSSASQSHQQSQQQILLAFYNAIHDVIGVRRRYLGIRCSFFFFFFFSFFRLLYWCYCWQRNLIRINALMLLIRRRRQTNRRTRTKPLMIIMTAFFKIIICI